MRNDPNRPGLGQARSEGFEALLARTSAKPTSLLAGRSGPTARERASVQERASVDASAFGTIAGSMVIGALYPTAVRALEQTHNAKAPNPDHRADEGAAGTAASPSGGPASLAQAQGPAERGEAEHQTGQDTGTNTGLGLSHGGPPTLPAGPGGSGDAHAAPASGWAVAAHIPGSAAPTGSAASSPAVQEDGAPGQIAADRGAPQVAPEAGGHAVAAPVLPWGVLPNAVHLTEGAETGHTVLSEGAEVVRGLLESATSALATTGGLPPAIGLQDLASLNGPVGPVVEGTAATLADVGETALQSATAIVTDLGRPLGQAVDDALAGDHGVLSAAGPIVEAITPLPHGLLHDLDIGSAGLAGGPQTLDRLPASLVEAANSLTGPVTGHLGEIADAVPGLTATVSAAGELIGSATDGETILSMSLLPADHAGPVEAALQPLTQVVDAAGSLTSSVSGHLGEISGAASRLTDTVSEAGERVSAATDDVVALSTNLLQVDRVDAALQTLTPAGSVLTGALDHAGGATEAAHDIVGSLTDVLSLTEVTGQIRPSGDGPSGATHLSDLGHDLGGAVKGGAEIVSVAEAALGHAEPIESLSGGNPGSVIGDLGAVASGLLDGPQNAAPRPEADAGAQGSDQAGAGAKVVGALLDVTDALAPSDRSPAGTGSSSHGETGSVLKDAGAALDNATSALSGSRGDAPATQSDVPGVEVHQGRVETAAGDAPDHAADAVGSAVGGAVGGALATVTGATQADAIESQVIETRPEGRSDSASVAHDDGPGAGTVGSAVGGALSAATGTIDLGPQSSEHGRSGHDTAGHAEAGVAQASGSGSTDTDAGGHASAGVTEAAADVVHAVAPVIGFAGQSYVDTVDPHDHGLSSANGMLHGLV